MKPFFSTFLIILMGCANHSSQDSKIVLAKSSNEKEPSYVWTKLLDSAAWKKSYNFQLFSCRDTLWTFHTDGNWFSTDGKNWIKSLLTNSISNLAFLDYVWFKDAMLGLGHFEGNIEHFTFSTKIYQTSHFTSWTVLSAKSNLPHRFFYHPFIFDNKIWIVGGEDKNGKYADIWNSPDGVSWTKQRDTTTLGKRSGSQVVLLNNRLFLLDNDVWSSSNGLDWEKVTGEIVTGEQVFGYAALVFDNKIWLLGCNRNGQFTSQVLYSADGKNWQSQEALWLPRGGIAATVHKNKIYMTGGKYGGTPNHPDFRYDNDVWMLEKR